MTSGPFPRGPGAAPLRDKTLRELLRWWWGQPFEYEWVYAYAESRAWLRLDRMVIAICCVLCTVVGATLLVTTRNPWPFTVAAIVATLGYAWGSWWWWANRSWPTERTSLLFIAAGDIGTVPLIIVAPNALLAMALLSLYILPGSYIMFLHGPRVLSVHLGWVTLVILSTAAYFVFLTERPVIPTVLLAAVLVFACTGGFVVGQIALTFLRNDARRSFIDSLTGLLNRRGLWEAVVHALTRYPDGSPVSVLMVDIDTFKPYNDTHGHTTGDELLREVALTLLRVCDSHADALSRIGGDEYVAVLHLDQPAAEAMAHRISEAVRDLPVPEPPTISVGAVTFHPPTWPLADTVLQDMLTAADRALYRSKAAGGGTVTALSP
ncbi:GGDEF domain-containing protein [Williamsia deligens]|uniref:GGDEF domain-containing protein n=1 Tax=Williamsia deligens TaxID=321325 RepID=A0ABW3G5E0_9NOCA|nr:GGDEF domain-containing protein [Williamsia deligens]MCP2193354.1 diguanylate cyclase (GGDEF) domain-containing protein [Williamsia deligens]